MNPSLDDAKDHVANFLLRRAIAPPVLLHEDKPLRQRLGRVAALLILPTVLRCFVIAPLIPLLLMGTKIKGLRNAAP